MKERCIDCEIIMPTAWGFICENYFEGGICGSGMGMDYDHRPLSKVPKCDSCKGKMIRYKVTWCINSHCKRHEIINYSEKRLVYN